MINFRCCSRSLAVNTSSCGIFIICLVLNLKGKRFISRWSSSRSFFGFYYNSPCESTHYIFTDLHTSLSKTKKYIGRYIHGRIECLTWNIVCGIIPSSQCCSNIIFYKRIIARNGQCSFMKFCVIFRKQSFISSTMLFIESPENLFSICTSAASSTFISIGTNLLMT